MAKQKPPKSLTDNIDQNSIPLANSKTKQAIQNVKEPIVTEALFNIQKYTFFVQGTSTLECSNKGLNSDKNSYIGKQSYEELYMLTAKKYYGWNTR